MGHLLRPTPAIRRPTPPRSARSERRHASVADGRLSATHRRSSAAAEVTSTARNPGRGTVRDRRGTRAGSPCRRTSTSCRRARARGRLVVVSTSIPQTGSISIAMVSPSGSSGRMDGLRPVHRPPADAGLYDPPMSDTVDPRRRGPGRRADRLRGEIGEAIVAPGQMTYGSQAAAASQVFEQQRDLALRDRHRAAARRSSRRRSRGSTTGPSGRASAAAADRARSGSRRCRGPPTASTASGSRPRPLRARPPTTRPRRRSSRSTTIRAAAERLRGIAIRTPARPVRAAAPIGASSRPSRCSRSARSRSAARTSTSPRCRADERARGVITYSSGNHAQGVARAARLLGAPAVVVMPSDAPAIKRRRVEADGAEVVVVGTASEERQQVAERIAGRARARDHPAVRRRPDHRRPGHGRARDRRGPAGRRRGPRADRRRRAGERGRGGGQGAAPGRPRDRRRAGARRRRARLARARAGSSSWPAELTCRGRSPTGRARRRSASGRSPTCRALLDAIVTVSEAEIAAGVRLAAERDPARRRAVRRAVDRGAGVPRRRGRPRRLDGPVVAVGRGGNVDPERYARYLEAPIPPRLRRLGRAPGRRVARQGRLRVGPLAFARAALGRAGASRMPDRAARSASSPPVDRGLVAPLSRRASSRRGSRPSRIRNRTSPADPHEAAGQLLVVERGRAPRPDERRVVRVEHGRRVQDRHRQERVLGHLQEQVHDPDGMAHPPRARVEADRRPPEQQPAGQEQGVLEIVDDRVLERRVEQRREVGPPHHRREDDPGHDREAPEPASPASGGRAGSPGAGVR